MPTFIFSLRNRAILHRLFREGPLSRSQLHEKLGLRKNTVGDEVEPLITAGVLREAGTQRSARGRPHTQLEIDPARRRVLGVWLNHGRIEVASVNLFGQHPIHLESAQFRNPKKAVAQAASILRHLTTPEILQVGVALPGFMDPGAHTLLLSRLFHGGPPTSLQLLYDAVGRTPLVLGNITHAFAASWLLHSRPPQEEDSLIVLMEDGQIGSALLVEARPNTGCVMGANEIGHTRLAVNTARCYCGQSGCLERIFDSSFLTKRLGQHANLEQQACDFNGRDPVLAEIIELLALGLANAVNLTRVHRLVLVSSFGRYPIFAEALVAAVRRLMLRELASRVRVQWGDFPATEYAPAAAALPLAGLYYEGWHEIPAGSGNSRIPP